VPQLRFTSRDGTPLCGRLTTPAEPRGGVVVLCHPHPKHGGSMEAWMLPFLQRLLVGDGWTGFRFDFRGAGGSGGRFEGGAGEQDDVAAAVDHLLAEVEDPGGPLLLGGWSFGAAVSLHHALGDDRVEAWFGVGLPHRTGMTDVPTTHPAALHDWTVPKLFVHGSADQFTPLERVEELASGAAPPVAVVAIDGGDHYLADRREELGDAVVAFARGVRDGGDG
jgi:alpha/beta superfamily hydrolase